MLSSSLSPSPSINGGVTQSQSNTSSFSIFSLISPVFWREVFDVTTTDVIERLRLSILPTSSFSLLTAVQLRPDWWGPFWISATLALLVAAGGQFGGWLSYSMPPGCMQITTDVASCEGAIYAGHPFMRDNFCCTADGAALLTSLQAGRKVAAGWRFDIYAVVSAIMLFDGFLLIAPLSLRAAFAYIGLSPQGATTTGSAPLGVVHLVCIYGYALSALIPASLLCATGNSTLQWIVIFLASIQGLIVVVQNIYRPLAATAHIAGQRRPVFVLGLIAFHFVVLALILKIYFYNTP
jgi:hypothetical protein